jgi:hypothetical protein
VGVEEEGVREGVGVAEKVGVARVAVGEGSASAPLEAPLAVWPSLVHLLFAVCLLGAALWCWCPLAADAGCLHTAGAGTTCRTCGRRCA